MTETFSRRVNLGLLLSLLFITSAVLALVFTAMLHTSLDASRLTVGSVASYSIRAPHDFAVEDEIATERKRAEAEQLVKAVFRVDDVAIRKVEQRLDELFKNIAQRLENNHLDDKARHRIEDLSRIDFVGAEWELLESEGEWRRIKQEVVSALKPLVARGIIASKEPIVRALSFGGALAINGSSKDELPILSEHQFYDVREAEQMLLASVDHGGVSGAVTRKIASSVLEPTVKLDIQETERRVREVRSNVHSLYHSIRRGEVIVRAGDIITDAHKVKLDKLAEIYGGENKIRAGLGYFLLSLAIVAGCFIFLRELWPGFYLTLRDLAVVSCVLVGNFILLKIAFVLGTSLSVQFSNVDPTVCLFAAPLAVGGLLLQTTIGSSAVMLFILMFASLLGVAFNGAYELITLATLGNFIGALRVRRCSRRSAFLLAALRVSLVGCLVVGAAASLFPSSNPDETLFALSSVIIGGILSGIIAVALTPVIEYLGGYISDIKLLELASLDHPLLRELSVQAPGTWNHSMVMGQLGEAAAEAIGANSLLTRVGAYYHDIGKARKPLYFVENQNGENRHDKIPPSMSALILRAHVKDGIEMARQHKLPEVIVDMIPQHHGTALMEFFFEKAKREAEAGEQIDESLYRYPGPKPQTKEAGILMLADSVEAASRTIPDPIPAKIQGAVQKIINKVFISGQLEESELTLRDLHLIAKNFTRILTGIYHRRIEYSEPAEKVRGGEDTDKRKEESRATAPQQGADGEGQGDPKEALKRLGIG